MVPSVNAHCCECNVSAVALQREVGRETYDLDSELCNEERPEDIEDEIPLGIDRV